MRICIIIISLFCLLLDLDLNQIFAADIRVGFLKEVPAYHVIIMGKIQKGDFEKFKQTLDIETVPIPKYVNLTSIGGDLIEAMKIGNLIRAYFIPTTAPFNYKGKNLCPWLSADQHEKYKCDCASACFIMWAAGIERNGNVIGLHRPYFSKEYFENLSASEAKLKYENMSNDVRSYLKNMDIPDSIIDKMFSISSDEILYLDEKTIESIETVPFFDEWIKASCKPLTKEEQHELFELLNKKYDPNLKRYDSKRLSKSENYYLNSLSEKSKNYNECRRKKLGEAQAGINIIK